MLADMGCVVSHEASFPPPSKFPRPYARFRAAAAAVRAIFRFQYMCRRKREYLQSKSEKLDPTGKSAASTSEGLILVSTAASLPKVTFSAPLVSDFSRSISRSASSGIGRATGIPTAVSNIGIRSVSGSHSRTRTVPPFSSQSSLAKSQEPVSSGKHASTGHTKRSSPKQHEPVSIPHSGSNIPRKSSSHSTTGTQGESAKKSASSASAANGGVASKSSPSYSPQLLEYMEGLEQYQSRLNKTKPSSRHSAL